MHWQTARSLNETQAQLQILEHNFQRQLDAMRHDKLTLDTEHLNVLGKLEIATIEEQEFYQKLRKEQANNADKNRTQF